jgi:predicted enzyme related to lactoylglutathione lyase
MPACAVIYVGDLDRMRTFYTRCFGLTVADAAEGYCGLKSEAWLLTLIQSAQAVAESAPACRREHTPIKLAFEVGSIAAVRELAAGLGGHIDPGASEWEFQDARRCDGVDPEGNVFQLIQNHAISPSVWTPGH